MKKIKNIFIVSSRVMEPEEQLRRAKHRLSQGVDVNHVVTGKTALHNASVVQSVPLKGLLQREITGINIV